MDMTYLERMTIPEPNTGCWLWLGAVTNGYGVMNVRGKLKRVTRRVLEMVTGEPLGARFALHRCHVPSCCNPDHLYVGDRSRNTHDAIKRGTHNFTRNPALRAAGHFKPKLTADQVRAIRARVKAGERQAALGREYGIARSAVSMIIKWRNWGRI